MSNYNGPDGCPTYYFDSNMMPNFNGTCNNNMPGGYEMCCMCGGESGGIGQCPKGCYDSPAGECVPNNNKPPEPKKPVEEGCYSIDVNQGDYFKMDINDPSKCVPPNLWFDPNSQPPQPLDPDFNFCKNDSDCKEGLSCIGSMCIPTKWTKDFYEKIIKVFASKFNIPESEVRCIFSIITHRIPNPKDMLTNQDIVNEISNSCKDGKLSSVAPKLYDDSVKKEKENNINTKQLLFLILMFVLAALLLYFFFKK